MLYFIYGGFRMDEIIEDYYKKYQKINAIIKKKTEEKNKVLNSLLKSKVGKLYFNLRLIFLKPHIHLTKVSHKLWTCHQLSKPRPRKCFSFSR